MENFIDKSAKVAVGRALWELRCEKKLRIQDVAAKTHIPVIRIDLMEMGRRFSFGDYQALIRFYGKKMKVTFEDK